MKRFAVVALVAGALALVGIVAKLPVLVALAVVTAAGAAVVGAFSKRRSATEGTDVELGAEARWILRPIRELRESLRAISRREGASPEVSVIAQEAVSEADHIYDGAVRLVQARESLKQSLKGQGEAETNVNRLERQLAEATDPGVQAALQSALDARRQEIAAYAGAKAKMAEIDGRLKIAEATMAELKARLATGAAGPQSLGEQQTEFADMVERLKTLGHSFDEAQQMTETLNQ